MSTWRRLNLDITGSTRGVEAALNRINAGLGRTAQESRSTNRELGLMQRQMQAVGTTARYWLAGQVVFGIGAAIQRLTDFNAQLGVSAGLLGTLGRGGQYTAPSKSAVAQLADDAILQSNKLGIAAEDVMSYQQRFLSAFDIPDLDKRRVALKAFTDTVTQLQATMGQEAGDPQTLAGGVASFVGAAQASRRARGQRPGTVGDVSNEVASMILFLTQKTPNITGRNIAMQIGRMQTAMTAGGMSPEELFAVWTQAGKAGGSADVIARGLTQLMGTSILNPKSATQIAAFRQVGLPTDPNQLRQMGGFQILMRMLERVGGRNVRVRNPRALTDEALGDEEAVQAAGVQGIDIKLLNQMFGRQESVRQFLSLITQGGPEGLRNFVKALKASEDTLAQQRFDAVRPYRTLIEGREARRNIGLNLVRGLSGDYRGIPMPLDAIARGTQIAANEQVRHPRIAHALELAAVGFMGGRLLRRLRRGGVGGAPGELAGAAVMSEQAPAVIAGGLPDGSREKPFWVIVSPWSRTVGGIPEGGVGRDVPGGAGLLQRAKNAPGWLKGLLGGGALTGAATQGRALVGLLGEEAMLSGPLALSLGAVLASRGAGGARPDLGRRNKITSDLLEGGRTFGDIGRPELATPLLSALAAAHLKPGDVQRFEMTGSTKADLTIKLVDAHGRTITVTEKKGVPLETKVIPAKSFPTKKGKPKGK